MNVTEEDIVDNIRIRLDRPVVLVGMMGAGKTRIGRQLARKLRLKFLDSDDEIEKAAGLSIAEIFKRFGEDYFRDGERRVISRLLEQGACVIATGGGAVMNEETAAERRNKTVSVWIRAEMDLMVKRTARRDHRPLLREGDPREILTALAEKRYPVYEKADIVIDSHDGPVDVIVGQALDKIDRYLRNE